MKCGLWARNPKTRGAQAPPFLKTKGNVKELCMEFPGNRRALIRKLVPLALFPPDDVEKAKQSLASDRKHTIFSIVWIGSCCLLMVALMFLVPRISPEQLQKGVLFYGSLSGFALLGLGALLAARIHANAPRPWAFGRNLMELIEAFGGDCSPMADWSLEGVKAQAEKILYAKGAEIKRIQAERADDPTADVELKKEFRELRRIFLNWHLVKGGPYTKYFA